MTDTLVHRGPDAGDIWLDPEAGLALGHRRLSIIDLSPAGAQPMVSSCGRFVISYNGEVYNADELRPELEAAGRRFRGHSDTEAIVEGAAVWGVEATVKRLIGMFAMALWDRRERALYLVRDRLGIKPLYWAEFDGRLLFGSELKALRADRSWAPELDRDALLSYLRFGYVPAPDTIYRGVHKLPPGTILRCFGRQPARRHAVLVASGHRPPGSERAASPATRTTPPMRSIRCCGTRSGAAWSPTYRSAPFCRAGSNSSTVVALMQAQSTRPVRTFSIGFHERGVQRERERRRRRAASRDRAYRAVCRAAPCARRNPAARRHVRRAVCQLVADADLSRIQDDARACHGRAVRRWRRRAVRRLYALLPRPGSVAGDRRHAATAARARRPRYMGAAAFGLVGARRSDPRTAPPGAVRRQDA